MQVATEVASASHVEEALAAGLDTFWIGARTTTSPFAMAELAEALSGERVTVLVKNPLNPTSSCGKALSCASTKQASLR